MFNTEPIYYFNQLKQKKRGVYGKKAKINRQEINVCIFNR